MEDIDKILLKMIGTQANQNQYHLFKLKKCWFEIIGKNNARHCSPVKLERRILTIMADSSAWSNQFMFYKNQFIKKINEFMGIDYVKDIKFISGRNFKKNISNNNDKKTDEIKFIIPALTEEEKESVALKLSYIKNEDLKNAILNVEVKRAGLEKLYQKGKIKKCPYCGSFIKDDAAICFVCERKRKKAEEIKIWGWIKKEPWIRWNEISKIVGCDETTFIMIKNDMESYYFEKVRNKTASEVEKKIAVQLKSGMPYALLSEKDKENILNFLQKGK